MKGKESERLHKAGANKDKLAKPLFDQQEAERVNDLLDALDEETTEPSLAPEEELALLKAGSTPAARPNEDISQPKAVSPPAAARPVPLPRKPPSLPPLPATEFTPDELRVMTKPPPPPPGIPTPPPRGATRVPGSIRHAPSSSPSASISIPPPPAAPPTPNANEFAFDKFKTNDNPPKQLYNGKKWEEGAYTDGGRKNITVSKDPAGKISIHSDCETLTKLAKALGHGPTNPVEFTHLEGNPKEKKQTIEAMLKNGIAVKLPSGELNDSQLKDLKAKYKGLSIEEIKPPTASSAIRMTKDS